MIADAGLPEAIPIGYTFIAIPVRTLAQDVCADTDGFTAASLFLGTEKYEAGLGSACEFSANRFALGKECAVFAEKSALTGRYESEDASFVSKHVVLAASDANGAYLRYFEGTHVLV